MSANEPKPTAIVRRAKPQIVLGHGGFEFTLDKAREFGEWIINEGMAPKGVTTPGGVVALMQAGREIGLPPMYALSNMTFTNGRIGIMGDAAKALIRARKMLKPGTDFDVTYTGEEFTLDWTCTVTAWRVDAGAPVSRSFSLREAVAAGLARLDGRKVQAKGKGDNWNSYGPWSTYTKRMLMYRALGFLCRDEFSDVLGGAVLMEELRDYPAEKRRGEPPAGDDPLLNSEELTVEKMTAREHIGAILGEFYEGNLEAMKKAFQIVTGKRFFPNSEPGSEFYSSVKQLSPTQADELLADLRSGTIALPPVEAMFPAPEPPIDYEEEGPDAE